MKNLFILLIIALFASCSATSKLSKSLMKYNEGDDLIYEVNTKDDDGDDLKYEIELNINGVEEYYVSFDWEIFAERSGTIKMNEKAIKNATTLTFFEKEGYQPLEDKTTIWLSQAVFKKLKATEKVSIGLEERKETFQMIGTETYNFGKKNYNIPVIIVKNSDHSIEMWIADDAKNPIMVQLRMKDFRMDLMDYKLFE